MKVSLKVREERRPMVRAKLPLNVLGLPVFTGVTSGDPDELALHLGTDVQAGPSFRVSYKPNNVFSPFSVLVKTGFGLWGSPHGAALAMSAEFDLNSNGSPSFSVRMKPKFGDFGFQKDSGRFKASYENVAGRISRGTSSSGDKLIAMDNSGEEHMQLKSSDANLTTQKSHDPESLSLSPNGKGLANGDAESFVTEKTESLSNGLLELDSEKIDSSEKSSANTTPEKVKRVSDPSPSDEGALHYSEHVAESIRNAVTGPLREVASTSVGEGLNSRLEAAAKGWRFNAHSSLSLGSWAVAKVRWQVKFGSDFFHDVRHGLHITDIRLPALTMDKVSFEALNPKRNRRSGAEVVDLAGLGYGCDDGSPLGRIASMCASMRYQIQLLHLENKFLKSTIDEWRGDLPRNRGSGSKGTDLMMPEESALRSQIFDDLNGKLNGGGNGSGKLNGSSGGKTREGRYGKDGFSLGDSQSSSRPSSGKGTTSTGEEFTISKDPSEELQKAILNATSGGH